MKSIHSPWRRINPLERPSGQWNRAARARLRYSTNRDTARPKAAQAALPAWASEPSVQKRELRFVGVERSVGSLRRSIKPLYIHIRAQTRVLSRRARAVAVMASVSGALHRVPKPSLRNPTPGSREASKNVAGRQSVIVNIFKKNKVRIVSICDHHGDWERNNLDNRSLTGMRWNADREPFQKR